MNLLKETVEILTDNKKQPKDVLWCGSDEFGWFSWEDFVKVADIEYDHGYGGQEIARDLLIVGNDWYLERHEYDGSEWWEYKTIPIKPTKHTVLKTVCNGESWATLKEMNQKGGKYNKV